MPELSNPAAELAGITAARIRGHNVSLQDLLHTLKVNGKLSQLLGSAIDELLISQAAERLGLSISDQELQQAADRFRQQAGLEKAADTQRWLEANGLDALVFESRLEGALKREKVKEQVTKDKVEPYFAENRTAFDQAVLSHVVVEDEGIAQELLSQIQEDEADLGQLASKHSVDKATQGRAGQLGLVSRKALSPQIESAVFSAKEGDVVGPLKTDMGYHIIKVEELRLGQLNDAITASISENLFGSWLADQYKEAGVEVTLGEIV